MNYLLFANPQTGSKILTALIKESPPKIVITKLNSVDSWKRIIYRFLRNKFSVEDKLRFFYKIEFYDYKAINVSRLKKIIKKNKIEIGFITTFPYIIPKDLYELFPRGVYNFHPSLLPKHGGANPFFWIIYYGDEYSGTTCYKITDVLDNGPIILQSKYNISKLNSLGLFNLYVKDVKKMIPKILDDYDSLIMNSKEMNVTIYDPKEIAKINLNDKVLSNEIRNRYLRAIKLYKK